MLPISICIFISFSTKTFFAYLVVRYFKKLELSSFKSPPILYSAYALSLLVSPPPPPAKNLNCSGNLLRFNWQSNVFECCAISAASLSSDFSKTSCDSENARFKFLESTTNFFTTGFSTAAAVVYAAIDPSTQRTIL